jgi:hypothetical protein
MEWSCCDWWGSSVYELGFQQDLLAYTYVLDPVHINFNLHKIWLLPDHLEHNCCVNWGESVITLKSVAISVILSLFMWCNNRPWCGDCRRGQNILTYKQNGEAVPATVQWLWLLHLPSLIMPSNCFNYR